MPINDINNNNPTVDYNADPITNSASLKYKRSIIGKTLNNGNDNDRNNSRK